MKPIILLSTYALSREEQWNICRMVERAGVSHFEFIVLEDRRGNVEDLQRELNSYVDEPTMLTLDATALEFAHAHLQNYVRLVDWYKPSLSYMPPKVIGQQLSNVLQTEATTEDEEGQQY